MAYALRLLSGRAYSEQELRLRLQRRATDPSEAEAVLESLRQYGYLDDRRFAEAVATSRLENESLGRLRVLAELRRRRVDRSTAEEAVASVYADTDEVNLIERYLERKFRNVDLKQALEDPRQLLSVYRRLRRAGFSSSSAIRVLRRYSTQADELEHLEQPEPEAGPSLDMLEA